MNNSKKITAMNDINQVCETTNYNMFSYMVGNREVVHNHVLNLAKSIKVKDLEIPIIVNEMMQVCDGQHRLEACKLVGKPVTYIVKHGLSLEDIRSLNSTNRKWTSEEYLMSFVKLGHKDYEILHWFVETYKFSISNSMSMLNDKGYVNSMDLNDFKLGLFKVSNVENAKDIAQKIIYIGEYFEHYRKRSFIAAMMRALHDKDFIWTTFKQRLENFSGKLKNQGGVDDFTDNIERLYNHQTSIKNRIKLRRFYNSN